MGQIFHIQTLRSIARWALVLFVMAWLNLVVQAPAHAAMKQDQSMPCHCDVTLCDTVLSLEDQADDALGFASIDISGFQIAFVTSASIEPMQAMTAVLAINRSQQSNAYHPPPLLLKTTLLI